MEFINHSDPARRVEPAEGSGPDVAPSFAEVRNILAAAADVLFSDGVPDAFLDQWTDETRLVLQFDARAQSPARSRRR